MVLSSAHTHARACARRRFRRHTQRLLFCSPHTDGILTAKVVVQQHTHTHLRACDACGPILYTLAHASTLRAHAVNVTGTTTLTHALARKPRNRTEEVISCVSVCAAGSLHVCVARLDRLDGCGTPTSRRASPQVSQSVGVRKLLAHGWGMYCAAVVCVCTCSSVCMCV